MPIFALIAALMLTGGSAALAAESALPGDFLYPVKLHVNEAVRANLNFSEEARAAFETELAERRLTEAQSLTAMGRINASVRNELFTSFRQHLAESATAAEGIEDADTSAALKTNIRVMLDAHAAALQSVSASVNDGALSADIDEILNEVKANTMVHAGADLHLPNNMPALAVNIMINMAEKQIEKTEERIDDADASAAVEADARARLALAVTGLTEAKAALATGNNADAFTKAKKAHRQAIEAKIMLATGAIFDRDNEDDNDDGDNTSSRTSSSHSSTQNSNTSSVTSSVSTSAASNVSSLSASSITSSVVASSLSSHVSSNTNNEGDDDDEDDDENIGKKLGKEIQKRVHEQIDDMKKRMKDRFDFDD